MQDPAQYLCVHSLPHAHSLVTGTLDAPTPSFVRIFTLLPFTLSVTSLDTLLVVPESSYMFTFSLQNNSILHFVIMLVKVSACISMHL